MTHATIVPPTGSTQPITTSLPVTADAGSALARSRRSAGCLITGLPLVGLLTSLFFGLPLFAALMSGCFLLAAGLTCYQAVATFTSRTLHVLIHARVVLVLVVAALLFCASGSVWMAVISAIVLWLSADRLLGRPALCDLWTLVRSRT